MMQLLSKIGLNDVIDIAFVTLLLYTAIVWFKRTRAALVILGFFILGAMSILAWLLEMKLTAWLFQGFFAVLLIIIVVVFQVELRQIFERLAIWSLRRGRDLATPSRTVDIIVQTLVDLARDRIGALIVIPGRDAVGRVVAGGIVLNGTLSEPLLKSLFDPHSPGHDGAVIIEGNKIKSFAVHLPLSRDFSQLARVGTRHSAALGLAELSDALCLVVSEERGQVSYAKNGTLTQVHNLQKLAPLLEELIQEKKIPLKRKQLVINFFRKHWVEKTVSLLLALGLWYVLVARSQDSVLMIPSMTPKLSPPPYTQDRGR
jgi:diadenylate cyclase